MKKQGILIGLLSAALMLSACGSGSSSDSATATTGSRAAASDMYSYAAEEAAYYDEDVDGASNGSSGTSSVEVQDTSRKLIRNVDISAETNNMDEMVANIEARVNEYGGYIENSYIDNNSTYSYSRYASMTIRVPATKLDDFLSNIGEISNITSKSVSVTDVTLQYVDVEAKKESLEAQQTRLLELMEEATTIEEIMDIEERLADIRYQLESAEKQLRSYDNQVDYSTVYLNVSEVKEYTPVEEKSRWEEMTSGFVSSLSGAVGGFLDFLVGLVVALPYIIIWGLVIALCIFIVIKIVRKCSEKSEIRFEERQAKREERAAKRKAELEKKKEELAKKPEEGNAPEKTKAEEAPVEAAKEGEIKDEKEGI